MLSLIQPPCCRTALAADRTLHIEVRRPPIALIPENAQQVSASVAELRRSAEVRTRPAPNRRQQVSSLKRQCREVAAAFEELAKDKPSAREKPSLWDMCVELLDELRDVVARPDPARDGKSMAH